MYAFLISPCMLHAPCHPPRFDKWYYLLEIQITTVLIKAGSIKIIELLLLFMIPCFLCVFVSIFVRAYFTIGLWAAA
jgi:hypothetical protein